MPEAQRALNLVELDPAASPAEVAAELATGGLFGGCKVVLVHEPAFLTSKEDAEAAFDRARDQWAKGAQRDAARRLLALAAKAGWSATDLAPGAIDHDALARDLGLPASAYDAAFVEAAARYAAERELKVAKDDSSALDAALDKGFARGHVLVVAAGKVDGRLPLVKKLAAAGRRVTIQLEKEGTWDAQRLVLGPVLESLLAGTGKRVDRAGEARLAALVGEDARTLASEVAKLAAYVGDRKVIGAEDVDAVVVARRVGPVLRARQRRRGPRPPAGAGRARPGRRGRREPVHAARLARGHRPAAARGARARAPGRGRPADRELRRVAGGRAALDPRRGARREEAVRVLDEVPGRDALLASGAARRVSPRSPRPTSP